MGVSGRESWSKSNSDILSMDATAVEEVEGKRITGMGEPRLAKDVLLSAILC